MIENPIEIILYIFLVIFAIPVVWILFPTYKVRDGFLYSKYPLKNSFGSLPNPEHIKRGYKWTSIFALKKLFSKSKKARVFIDTFRFDDDYASKSSLVFRKTLEKTEFYFDPLKMTQGLLLVGKMGSGKTEFYFNLLAQKFYNRVVIHQVKAGDFAETLLRKRDMLFSPYDKRGYLWDIMSENEGIIKTFFENYTNAVMGDKKDFFSAAAQRLYNELSIKVKTTYKDEESSVKWLLFIKAIKDLFLEMDSGSQKSKQDVKSTMEAILEPLEIMAYMMQNPKQKKFVIADFFKRKGQCRLILDNIPEYEKSLTPLFSAFTACMSQVHTSLPDSKTDFTLYALDEYLSFLQVMDDASKKRLHTLIRSKGGILIPAVQYIPKDDKKLQQLLTSSAYAWIYFSVIEEETINLLKQSIGETEYAYADLNKSYSKSGENRSYTNKNEKTNLIYNELLNGLGDKFEHIVYLPNHKALYKGYTAQANLKVIAKKSVPVNLDEFYRLKYIKENDVKEDLKNLTFADLFKEKPLSQLDEYRMFKRFEKIKAEQGKEGIKEFKAKEKLEQVDLSFLFKKFMADKQVIANKMQILNIDERFKLSQEWNKLEDEAEQLEFIKANDLFGALPNLFDFADADIESLEDDF